MDRVRRPTRPPEPAAPEGGAAPAAPAPRLTSAQRLAERAKRVHAAGKTSSPWSGRSKDPAPPEVAAGSLDLVTLMFNYHDLGYLGVDRARMNRAAFAVLKPGGIYVVADTPAAGHRHFRRRDVASRREAFRSPGEIELAGFKLGRRPSKFPSEAPCRSRATGTRPEPPIAEGRSSYSSSFKP